jgi:hypothetical protein
LISILSLVLIGANALTAFGQQYCASLAGQWYGGTIGAPNSSDTYFDLQDVSGTPQTIAGTYNDNPPGPGTCSWPVTGTMKTDGTFQVTISAKGSGCPAIGTWTGQFYGGTSCSQILWTIGTGNDNTWVNHRTSCPVPNSPGVANSQGTSGEGQTIFVTFDPPAFPSNGIAQFQATLKPPINLITGKPYTYFNWGGRGPMETFSNFVDTCTPTQVASPSEDPYPFPITNGNEINDYVGYQVPTNPNAIRAGGDVLPCGLTWQQTMSIDCDAGYGVGTLFQYEKHSMLVNVNASTITIQRNGTGTNPPNQPYGASQLTLQSVLSFPFFLNL